MSRVSTDEYINGKLVNGFDYLAQVWVKDGIVQPCGHTYSDKAYYTRACCNQGRYAGKGIEAVRAVVLAAASAE